MKLKIQTIAALLFSGLFIASCGGSSESTTAGSAGNQNFGSLVLSGTGAATVGTTFTPDGGINTPSTGISWSKGNPTSHFLTYIEGVDSNTGAVTYVLSFNFASWLAESIGTQIPGLTISNGTFIFTDVTLDSINIGTQAQTTLILNGTLSAP